MDAVHKYFNDKLAGKPVRRPRASLLGTTAAVAKQKR
jgi:hypothetical protein